MNFTIFLFYRKNEKTPETLDFTGFSGGVFGVPEVIRTPDLPLRRRSLYPAELRKQTRGDCGFYYTTFCGGLQGLWQILIFFFCRGARGPFFFQCRAVRGKGGRLFGGRLFYFFLENRRLILEASERKKVPAVPVPFFRAIPSSATVFF